MAKAKAPVEKDMTPVTLVFTRMCTPYREGDVATFPKYQADQILDEREDADGEVLPPAARLFDPATDEELHKPYGPMPKDVNKDVLAAKAKAEKAAAEGDK